MIVSLYTSRVVLNVLGVDDFGIHSVVGGIVYMFSFLSSSMSSATQRFLSFEMGKGNDLELNKVFSSSILIYFILGIVILVISEIFGLWFLKNHLSISNNRLDAAIWVFHFSIFSLFLKMLQIPYSATIIAHEKMWVYAYINILEVGFKLALVYLLAVIEYDKLKLFAILTFITSLFIFGIYKYYCNKNFKESKFKFHKDKILYKSLISFSGWSLFGNIAIISKEQGVNILLNMFFNPAVNAARAIAYQIQGAIQSFVFNFQMAVNPQIIKSYAANDKKYMFNLIFSSSKFSYYLLFLISLPILLETNFILKSWLGMVPDFANLFSFLIIINALIDCVSGSLMIAAQATGDIKKYQISVGSILMLNLPIAYFFLKFGYPPEITFYISILLSLISFIIRLLILKKILKLSVIQFIKEVVIKVLIVSIVSIIIPFFLQNSLGEGIFRFFVVSIVSIISVFASVFFIGLSISEKSLVLSKITYFFNKISIKK